MKLEAQSRQAGDPRAVRRAGRLPAVLYNKVINQPVSVDMRAFDKVFRETGTSHLIQLELDGEVHRVLVKAVQMDKRRRVPQHVDFYAVTAGQKLTVAVSIHLVGTPVGVRDGGQLDIQRREVTISVLPRHIPEDVKLDVSDLTIGDSKHVSDLVELLPAEAEVLDDLELAVVAVVPPRLAIEEEEAADEELEPELVGEGEGDEDEDEDDAARGRRRDADEDADEG